MKKITRKQLIEILLNPAVSKISGASFIGLDTLTDVKLEGGKSNEMLGLVQKVTVGSNVMVFQNKTINGYQSMVKRRLLAEGKDPESFQLQPRKWGVRIENSPLVFHPEKEQYYLEVIFLKSGDVSYLYNGKPIRKDFIKGLKAKKEEGSQGGLDNKVIVRDYKIDSICRITIDKEVYLIVD